MMDQWLQELFAPSQGAGGGLGGAPSSGMPFTGPVSQPLFNERFGGDTTQAAPTAPPPGGMGILDMLRGIGAPGGAPGGVGAGRKQQIEQLRDVEDRRHIVTDPFAPPDTDPAGPGPQMGGYPVASNVPLPQARPQGLAILDMLKRGGPGIAPPGGAAPPAPGGGMGILDMLAAKGVPTGGAMSLMPGGAPPAGPVPDPQPPADLITTPTAGPAPAFPPAPPPSGAPVTGTAAQDRYAQNRMNPILKSFLSSLAAGMSGGDPRFKGGAFSQGFGKSLGGGLASQKEDRGEEDKAEETDYRRGRDTQNMSIAERTLAEREKTGEKSREFYDARTQATREGKISPTTGRPYASEDPSVRFGRAETKIEAMTKRMMANPPLGREARAKWEKEQNEKIKVEAERIRTGFGVDERGKSLPGWRGTTTRGGKQVAADTDTTVYAAGTADDPHELDPDPEISTAQYRKLQIGDHYINPKTGALSIKGKER